VIPTAGVPQLGQLVVSFRVGVCGYQQCLIIYTLRKVNIVVIFPIILSVFRPRQRGLPRELLSIAGTLGLWVGVPLKPVLYVYYVCMEGFFVGVVLGR